VAAPSHRLQVERAPGAVKQFLSAPRARALIATIKPPDVVGKTRRRLAVELISELSGISRPTQEAGTSTDRARSSGGSAHALGEHLQVRAAVSPSGSGTIIHPGLLPCARPGCSWCSEMPRPTRGSRCS
jgi:hypothetical protein